ncbi:MAG: hypothetical protein ACJ790_11670 [Myxococcaceae bacterium]
MARATHDLVGWRASAMGQKRLGEVLLSSGEISDRELRLALHEQQAAGRKLGQVLIDLGLCEEREVSKALAVQAGRDFIDVEAFPIQAEAVKRVPIKVMKAHSVVPLLIVNGELLVATIPSNERRATEQVSFISGLRVRVAIGAPAAIAHLISVIDSAIAKHASKKEPELTIDY